MWRYQLVNAFAYTCNKALPLWNCVSLAIIRLSGQSQRDRLSKAVVIPWEIVLLHYPFITLVVRPFCLSTLVHVNAKLLPWILFIIILYYRKDSTVTKANVFVKIRLWNFKRKLSREIRRKCWHGHIFNLLIQYNFYT